jgi:LPXTG-motif cell wall-anchored protein
MQIKQAVLRAAAAATVTVFLAAGVTVPAQATEESGTDRATHGTQTSEERSKKKRDGLQEESTSPDHTDGNASTEGDVDGPQPESTADQNDGGANSYDCENGPVGPYCGTDRTEPSANGNGDGDATGRPGAGTVGKADNKNPQGQEPGPSDRNNGYECDGNQGIAKGNPAHTGCTDGEPAEMPVEVVCPEDATMNAAGECVVPAEEDGSCPEEATMNDAGECIVPPIEVVDEVAGVELEATDVVAASEAEMTPASGLLPATGAGDYAWVLLAGLGLLGAGGVLLARRRPRLDG